MVISPEEGGHKEARYVDNNIIISDSTLRKIFHPNSRKGLHGTRSCVVISVTYMPKVYIFRYYHGGINILRN